MITLHHAYRTSYKTVGAPPGLGDYLRGSLALAHHARERGWRLALDFAGHPMGRFLKNPAPALAPDEPVAEFFDGQTTQVYRWMDELKPGMPSRLCTHLLPHESRIDAGICAIVRDQLDFAPLVLDRAARMHAEVSAGEFAVVHVRMADADFHTDQPAAAALLQRMESDLVPRWGRRLVVLSNNARVKRLLSDRFHLPFFDTVAVHLGGSDAGDAGIRDTLVDFALLGRASRIYAHSAYHWNSGFSRWAAALYGVPFEPVVPLSAAAPSPLTATVRWLREHFDPGF